MQPTDHPEPQPNSVEAAIRAVEKGYQPIPIRSRSKAPYGNSWTHLRHSPEDVEEKFKEYAAEGATNVGLLLGEPSGGLIDIDLDHPKVMRLKDYFLPSTKMRSGRAGRPYSHYWYIIDGTLPATRRYKMPDGSVSVELRSTGAQTVIAPSIHPSGESYRWEGGGWGEPTVVSGRVLAVQVALLALGAVLLENWPKQGSRHDAYLALAGGLLRYGDGVHPWWGPSKRNADGNVPALIRALAMVTHDEDGPDQREHETMRTTLDRLRSDGKAVGWPRLSEIIGVEHTDAAIRMAREIESLAGFVRQADEPEPPMVLKPSNEETGEAEVSVELDEDRNPLDDREDSWDPVDLEPYISGRITVPDPSVLLRTDGQGLMYPGMINSIYGSSEATKSWIVLYAAVQEIARGGRVVFLDFEADPAVIIDRVQRLGLGSDDMLFHFKYIRPEDPMAGLEANAWGDVQSSSEGRFSRDRFNTMLARFDPTLLIVDSLNALYSLHGLDPDKTRGAGAVNKWMKKLPRNGRTTVIAIDHTNKGSRPGSEPTGSAQKKAVVQGSSVQAYVHGVKPHDGGIGVVTLYKGKDRLGKVAGTGETSRYEEVLALVTIDSTEKGMTRMTIEKPEPAVKGDTVTIEGVTEKIIKEGSYEWVLENTLRFFQDQQDGEHTEQVWHSRSGIIAALQRLYGTEPNRTYTTTALAELASKGHLVHNGGRGSASKYALKEPGEK